MTHHGSWHFPTAKAGYRLAIPTGRKSEECPDWYRGTSQSMVFVQRARLEPVHVITQIISECQLGHQRTEYLLLHFRESNTLQLSFRHRNGLSLMVSATQCAECLQTSSNDGTPPATKSKALILCSLSVLQFGVADGQFGNSLRRSARFLGLVVECCR